jgi:hypothetical protein
MAVMLQNIHFRGALSGIASNLPPSMFCIFEPKRLASKPRPTATAAKMIPLLVSRS